MSELNVCGRALERCGTEPMTGFYRDGSCVCGPEDVGVHAVCAVMTAEFLAHQQQHGNDLVTPRPELGFPGLKPGDSWCVVAARGAQAYRDGVPAPVRLASTSHRALDIIPVEWLDENAIDIPDDPAWLDGRDPG